MENTAPPPVISYTNIVCLNFRSTFPLKYILSALAILLLSASPARAQSNPTSESCGLPVGGNIVQTAIYTLNADCELTSTLVVSSAASLTINGNGNKITAGDEITLIQALTDSGNTPTVTLNQVTLDASNEEIDTVLIIHRLIADQVSFINGDGVWGKLDSANHNWSLSKVLFRDNTSRYLFGENHASALDVSSSATLTLTNAAFERNFFGPSALKIAGSSATVTVSGCLSEAGNLPKFVTGSYSNNSTGSCAGNVGNGDSLRIGRARAESCGFPASGEIRANATYTLRANCQMTGPLYIKEGVSVRIIGNSRVIQGDPANAVIWVGGGGRLDINNLISRGMRIHVIRGHLEATLLGFLAPGPHRSLFIGGTANLNKLLIRDKTTASRNAVILLDIAPADYTGEFSLKITDGMFIDIVNASNTATLWAVDTQNNAATITLEGCISFIRTTGPEITTAQGVLVDNRTGPCPDSFLDEFSIVTPYTPPPSDDGGSSGSGSSASAAVTVSTIHSLPDHIRIFGFNNSTQAQVVSGAAIGNEAIARDAIAAVDVWSWVLPDTQVCFVAAGGRIKFIDTTAMPRTVHELAAYGLNGMVCATINGPGIVILLPGGPAPTLDTSTAGQSLSGCMVTANTGLNLRMNPGGAVIGGVAEGWTLTAVERTSGWFKVDRLGAMGWISADWVETQGACG